MPVPIAVEDSPLRRESVEVPSWKGVGDTLGKWSREKVEEADRRCRFLRESVPIFDEDDDEDEDARSWSCSEEVERSRASCPLLVRRR